MGGPSHVIQFSADACREHRMDHGYVARRDGTLGGFVDLKTSYSGRRGAFSVERFQYSEQLSWFGVRRGDIITSQVGARAGGLRLRKI